MADFARTTDPRTSHQAAAEVSTAAVKSWCERIEAAIFGAGPDGATLDEVCERLNHWMDRHVTSRRITTLRKDGRAIDSGRTRPGRSGRQQIVWITPHHLKPKQPRQEKMF